MLPATVYKICPRDLWEKAQADGVFRGAAIDLTDGFIHFSTAAQAAETARRHFAGQDGLLLVAVEAAALGEALVYEASRGGDLFPHLYGDLDPASAGTITTLEVGADGRHRLPETLT